MLRNICFAIGRAAVLFALLLLSGCDEQAWNSPYPDFSPDGNTLYTAFSIQPKTLDPAKSYSENELIFIAAVYEPPYEYNYLLRPYTLQPLTAATLAEPKYDPIKNISTYRIQIKPNIYYQQHPAFAKTADGKYIYHNLTKSQAAKYKTIKDFKEIGTRELNAADYIYEIKRLADPKVNSPVFGFLSPYLIGLKELRNQLSNEYKLKKPATELDLRDYELQGVRLIDNYTYEIDIKGKYPQFKYWLAMPFFAAMPWEAIKLYAQPGFLESNISIDWYPVGTGPYYLAENNPERRMIMLRNQNYHPDYYPSVGEPGDVEDGLLTVAGQRLPFIDQIVFSLEKESIPYWDKFLQGYYDRSGISSDTFNSVISGTSNGGIQLSPELLARNIRLSIADILSIVYWGFNMLDDTVGGYTEQARKLRQAISLAFDVEEYITIFTNGRGTVATGPIPKGIFGYQDERNSLSVYNLQLAKKLLAEAGYPNGINAKTGQPLQLYFEAFSSGDPDEKARFGWIQKQLAKLNIELIIRATDYNRFKEKMDNGDAQMYMWAWGADYPDPENFLFMFYSKNATVKHGGENGSNYSNPQFDALFEKFKDMEDTPERLALIQQMLQILKHDAPWIWGYFPQAYTLSNPWAAKGKPMTIGNNAFKYSRVDGKLRAKLQLQWNKPIIWPVPLLILTLIIIICPALIAYKRRETATAEKI